MTGFVEIISYENPVFRAYVFWSSILILKMLAMAYLTSRQRRAKKVVPNKEDLQFIKDSSVTEAKFGDPDVERVRRAHRNDLENCLPFLAAAFFYILTDPSVFIAVNLIRAAVIARIVHTFAYAILETQPARGIAWAVCFVITAYMSVKTAFYFC